MNDPDKAFASCLWLLPNAGRTNYDSFCTDDLQGLNSINGHDMHLCRIAPTSALSMFSNPAHPSWPLHPTNAPGLSACRSYQECDATINGNSFPSKHIHNQMLLHSTYQIHIWTRLLTRLSRSLIITVPYSELNLALCLGPRREPKMHSAFCTC